MERVIAIDTASGELVCYLCSDQIAADENLIVLGTGQHYWPVHWACYEATE